MKVNFLRLFIILFQNTLFLKEFLACNGCLGLFSKIKKESGANFWCTISAWLFCKKCSLFNSIQWAEFQFHTLSFSQYIKQNMLSMSLTLSLFLDQPLKQWLMGKKRGRWKYKGLNISIERSFLDEKNFFHSFEGLSFGEK